MKPKKLFFLLLTFFLAFNAYAIEVKKDIYLVNSYFNEGDTDRILISYDIYTARSTNIRLKSEDRMGITYITTIKLKPSCSKDKAVENLLNNEYILYDHKTPGVSTDGSSIIERMDLSKNPSGLEWICK